MPLKFEPGALEDETVKLQSSYLIEIPSKSNENSALFYERLYMIQTNWPFKNQLEKKGDRRLDGREGLLGPIAKIKINKKY